VLEEEESMTIHTSGEVCKSCEFIKEIFNEIDTFLDENGLTEDKIKKVESAVPLKMFEARRLRNQMFDFFDENHDSFNIQETQSKFREFFVDNVKESWMRIATA
jgi:hypothetical protein